MANWVAVLVFGGDNGRYMGCVKVDSKWPRISKTVKSPLKSDKKNI